ncbi:MAG TPA: hypothetical protein VFD27_01805 [Chthoniobacteraceae bacterium]|nr:hypothetical protein [Chthoniobacteraceae bacterium]
MNSTPLHELCLAGIVLLSLVLPFMASALARRNAAVPKPFVRTVWMGQAFGAVGGLLVIFSSLHPAWGLAAAVVSCALFGWLLRRQLRSA